MILETVRDKGTALFKNILERHDQGFVIFPLLNQFLSNCFIPPLIQKIVVHSYLEIDVLYIRFFCSSDFTGLEKTI